MSAAPGHLSQETLDLLQLASLPEAAAASARAHLEGCPTCRQRFEGLTADAKHFEQFVFARSLPRVEAQVSASAGLFSGFTLKAWLPALGLASALGIVGVVSVAGGGPGTGSQTEDEVYIGVKGGGPALAVYALRGDGKPFLVSSKSTLQPRDRLRFVVRPAGMAHVMVASRDGAGVFSVYHPFGATESAQLPLGASQKLELPGSVELDDTPGVEQLVAVFSDRPFKAADVEAALRFNAAEPRLAGAHVVTLGFHKEAH